MQTYKNTRREQESMSHIVRLFDSSHPASGNRSDGNKEEQSRVDESPVLVIIGVHFHHRWPPTQKSGEDNNLSMKNNSNRI